MSYSHLRNPDNRPTCGDNHTFTGRPLRTFEGHEFAVTCFIQLRDGRILSGSLDSTLRTWDYESTECLQIFLGHVKPVNCVLELRDGRAASGSKDKTIKLWDLESGQCLRTLEYHYEGVTCLLQLSTGKLMSGGEDTNLLIWDVELEAAAVKAAAEEGIQLQFEQPPPVMLGRTTSGRFEHDGHRRTIWGIIELADGRVATGGCDGWVRIWNLHTDQVEVMLEKARTVTQMSDGRLATASYDSTNTLWIWDMQPENEEGEPLPPAVGKKLSGSDDLVWGITQLGDGRLMSYGEETMIRVWNMKTDKCGWTLNAHQSGVLQASQLRDGLIMSCSRDKLMHVWQLPSK